ncbi:hypothetical protein [Aquimarina aquimarini]|uniref:hypothetical protein n=1 Tax=Aquimarina aquimarini TaxID=1191734 RepID=UPI001F323DAC|nr:hypothetical protein [Aquimarina aquimarini]
MSSEKIKIVEELRKKGFITHGETLNALTSLAINENEKKSELLKKSSIKMLNSSKVISQQQFLNLLISKLESY